MVGRGQGRERCESLGRVRSKERSLETICVVLSIVETETSIRFFLVSTSFRRALTAEGIGSTEQVIWHPESENWLKGVVNS